MPVCELDVGARTVRITRFEFVGSVDAALRDLSGVLERQLGGDDDSDEDSLEPLVAHFNSANGYSEDAGPLPMQQCYTLAYALRVALNNAPGPEVDGSWHAFLGAHPLPLPRPADAAEAIALACETSVPSLPINIGTGRETSIASLTEMIAKAVGYEGEVAWDTSKPDGQPKRFLDVQRARELLQFEARIGLEEGIRETVAWYRANASS